LEDFDLALDLLLFDGFEDFDDAFLVVDDVEAFEDFGVFAAAWLNCVSGLLLLDILRQCAIYSFAWESHTDLAHDLVVLQHAPANVHAVVIPVCPRHLLVDIGVHTRHDARFLGGVDPPEQRLLSPDD